MCLITTRAERSRQGLLSTSSDEEEQHCLADWQHPAEDVERSRRTTVWRNMGESRFKIER